ncbi:hypothetical protein J437_LFUL010204 [Ladona fulva]|uniref:Protein YIPF n=1 Tax=Ladona fulva TaxID=123851 RepID=A0A8K0P2V2_LADFU|nr:hypothetical protein J437_LFUL010204 [Ladona fulva]
MEGRNDTKIDTYDDFGDSDSLQGEITVNTLGSRKHDQSSIEFNTLDEPIRDTVLRDLKAVGLKFYHVLYPKEKQSLLKEWDLWGPLILCTFMAMILQGSTAKAESSNDGGPEFAEVFVIVWVGSVIVTVNSKLLGGNISFFQSVCVLGYCLLPTAIALVICKILLLAKQTAILFAIRLLMTVIGFGWATFASVKFLGDSQPPSRKALAVYPIFLFYFVISWLIISHSQS